MRGKTLPAGWEYAGELFGKGKVYIAGPMTGIPGFNIPAFDDTAWKLRQMGFDVVSPAELDGDVVRAQLLASVDGREDLMALTGETWGDFLARDLKVLADGGIEGVVVMKGWHESRGARLETFVAAALLGLPVVFEDGHPVPPQVLVKAWAGVVWEGAVDIFARRLTAALG